MPRAQIELNLKPFGRVLYILIDNVSFFSCEMTYVYHLTRFYAGSSLSCKTTKLFKTFIPFKKSFFFLNFPDFSRQSYIYSNCHAVRKLGTMQEYLSIYA